VGVSSHERPRGIILLAPFSSVQTLLDSYYIAGFVSLFTFTLFDALLNQHLPPLPDITAAMAGASDEVMEKMDRLSNERWALRRDLVVASEIPRRRV
jgi:hypothetical protein